MLRRMMPVISRTVAAALVVLAMAGCGSKASNSQGADTTTSSPTSSASHEAVPAIVGRWSNLHTCSGLVHAYRVAGLGKIAALQAAAFAPDTPNAQPPTPAQLEARARQLIAGGNLCAGAHAPFVHSHFFTKYGIFGSIQNGQQDDNGNWRVHGPYLYIGKSKFRYHIVDDNRLTLKPIIPPAQVRQALAHPLKFSDAGWMAAVAYTGSVWHRVPCHGWC
jgi:hypothetical protein